MQAFTYYAPTEIIFGANSENKTADMIKKYGGTRVMLVYGKGSVEKSGLLGKITSQLDAAGIPYAKHGGAAPNPHLSYARDGVKSAIDFGADFFLGMGGGSAIDAAKAIAHGARNPETDIWKFWLREAPLTKSYPIGVILTISAAGSETSSASVLTNMDTGQKRGFGSDLNRPVFAIMNPELTYSLPKNQLACGIADIMMHTMDRYFGPEINEGKTNELTDEIAEALLRTVIRNGPKILENPKDYDAQSEIMWSGSLSHTGLTGLGRTPDFSVHGLGHELSALFDVPHGESLTAMWGTWAEYVLDENPGRFARYAEKVWGATGNAREAAAEGIRRTVEFFKSIDMPTCFSEMNIGIQPDEVLQKMAAGAVYDGRRLVGSFKPLDKDGCYEVYKAANI